MSIESKAEGQYMVDIIRSQNHYNLLSDPIRLQPLKSAIEYVVFPGAKVLELGGGTGVLSWFAAAKADRVWCVESNPDLAKESNLLLAMNTNGDKVKVVHADVLEYLPPEPVDVVICDMIDLAVLRDKQVEMVEAFKARYRKRFCAPLPIMVPTAILLAIQPLQQNYNFEGFCAPIVNFHDSPESILGMVEMARPQLFGIVDFTQDNSQEITWEGSFCIEQNGSVNALRVISKNVLAIVLETSTTIEWPCQYVSFPLDTPVPVQVGQTLRVRFKRANDDRITLLQISVSN